MWANFLRVQCDACVITNLGLIIFTSKVMSGYSESTKLLTFLLAEHVLFSAKQLAIYLIPDVPGQVAALRRRHEFVNYRLFHAMVHATEGENLREVAERLGAYQFSVLVG